MAKLIRIDEFGAYIISEDIFGGCDDCDEDIGVSRTEDEYIIPNDAILEGL